MLNYQNDSNIRLVKNNSGGDVGQYEILKLDGPLFTPTDNATGWLQRQTIKGITPTDDCDFCITQRSVPNGKTQPALFSGCSPCTINVTDASHTHAKAGTTVDKLVSAESGPAKILWKESGTGDKNAFVLLSQAGGSSGSTVSIVASDYDLKADLDLTNSHATNYALVPQGGVNTVGTGFGNLVGTTWCDEAGTYVISYDVEFRVEEFEDEGSFTFTDTSTNDWTMHLLYERELYLQIKVWDESGDHTSGTVVADTVIGGCYPFTISDLNINDGSSGDFAFAPWRHATLTAGFSLTQATLDALTGDAQFGLFFLYQGTAGTKKAALKATVTGFHIPDVDNGLAISVTAATPP